MSVMRVMQLARRPLAAAVLAAVCLSAAFAGASERGNAERLYTKGLAELHAGHADAAITLFEQAVAADPKDMHALYYRALGYGHLGKYDKAAADLKVVVAAGDPALDRARLELGYALYRLGRYDEAVAELKIASQNGRSATEAAMLLGIVETRRGNKEAAQQALAQVQSSSPEMSVPARYYLGLAAWRTGDNEKALEEFSWVADNAGAGSPFGREAADFRDRIRAGGGYKPWQIHAGFALEYDSNVALAPDNGNVAKTIYGVSKEDDGRAVFTAGGQYSLVATPEYHLAIGYDFLQSLHFDLERFDVQTHRFGAAGEWLHGPLTLGLAGAFEDSLLDEDNLLVGESVVPWGRYDEGDFGWTELYYRGRYRNFVQSPYTPIRDSWNHAAGARQYFALDSREHNILLGYRFDSDVADSPVGEQYDYTGNQVETGLDWSFSDTMAAAVVLAYKNENYDGASASTATGGGSREDDIYLVITRLQKRIAPYTWLTGSYIFDRNDSNQTSFDYTRHITSLGVEVRY